MGDGLQSSLSGMVGPSVGVRLLFTSASACWRQRLLPRAATEATKLGIEFVFVIAASFDFGTGFLS